MFSSSIRWLSRYAFLTVVSLGMSGCSGEPKPEVGNVKGKVTLDGAAFAEGRVQFTDPKTARSSIAELKPDGTFEVVALEGGLRLGTYEIAVVPPPDAGLDPIEAAKGVKPPVATSKIPAMYREFATSGFKIIVKKGNNQADLDMKSK